MPATKKIDFHSAGHSQDLLALASTVHKAILKGNDVTERDLNEIVRLAGELKTRLGHSHPAGFDPFLTEAPKSDVAKLPTVQTPSVEKPVEKQKSGFLGR